MTGSAAALIASGMILYALVSLLAADRSSDTTSALARNEEQTISDLGLRFAWHK
jgi:hypothetical protein